MVTPDLLMMLALSMTLKSMVMMVLLLKSELLRQRDRSTCSTIAHSLVEMMLLVYILVVTLRLLELVITTPLLLKEYTLVISLLAINLSRSAILQITPISSLVILTKMQRSPRSPWVVLTIVFLLYPLLTSKSDKPSLLVM